ncbi:uncharacterized protein NESG_01629 [Nematocida ausubeli]|uniref:Uncharacterized protein n=1 Tax=Nematocida ausubeli (strain ATCC PRA-371 / ERTm2) TaxID=1913371 RepID=A0A086J0I3_NEMA1|nr:uncharacterized protein NESG_01629 [Nematocida ausubeli]KAI5136243.1 hypothetical protein NEAUS07_1543 [Nematocida ausubeli]KAI5150303.1 hypothetical protein NEAUS05_2119 [Nematocida ausubeli]KFG25651.1 hypothetical protein NESG_01629 [Nematocida ausubeli]
MNIRTKENGCLYNRNNKQISTKILVKVLFISIFLAVQNIFGTLSERCADNALETAVNESKNESNPGMSEPLASSRLSLFKKMNILHNIRFNPSYITRQTSALKTKDGSRKINRAYDTVKEKDLDENEIPKRIVDHYNALINMFPSSDGKISIYSKEGCEDSFTSFLKSENVKEYSHRILAVLLIRAEGVPVPMVIEEEENRIPRLVYTSSSKSKESFSLPIYTTITEGQESSSEENIEKVDSRVVQTIKYFLNVPINEQFKEEIQKKQKESKPKSKEINCENEFTMTPSWLIKSYICHYLKTEEDAIEFYEMAAKKLEYYIHKYALDTNYTDNMGVIIKKFRTYKEKQLEELEWWIKVNQLDYMVEDSKNTQPLPFKDNTQLPTKRSSRISFHEDTQLEEELISSDVESVVLTLLCCFGYNPETRMYNFGHLPSMSEEVKDLFGLSYTSNPSSNSMSGIEVGQEISPDIMKKLSEIIEKIATDTRDINHISVDGRYVIQPDIFNILIIMLKITGLDYNEYRRRILGYRILTARNMNINDSLSLQETDLTDLAKGIFSKMTREAISNSTFINWRFMPSMFSKYERKILVKFENYKRQTENDIYYLSGNLVFQYATKYKEQLMTIRFVSLEKVHLEIGKCTQKTYDSDNLQKEIMVAKKDSYSMYAISEHAETLKQCTSDDIVVDEVNREKSSTEEKNSKEEKSKQISSYISKIANFMKS